MGMENTATISVGDIVKLNPNRCEPNELNGRYRVLELRPAKGGCDTAPDRVLIQFICDMEIKPTECVPMSDIELA